MNDVFRQEVKKVRKEEKAVVVFCVDAVNITGTVLTTLREYVGGNPILLAVTRCDLLPRWVSSIIKCFSCLRLHSTFSFRGRRLDCKC